MILAATYGRLARIFGDGENMKYHIFLVQPASPLAIFLRRAALH